MFRRDELPEILERAESAGVGGVLVPSTGADDLELALDLAAERPHHLLAAAGVHPHDASSLHADLKRRILQALDQPGVVAVGEVGLDYHYMNSPREDQVSALEWQLDLALEADLPVVLHNRESWPDLEVALAARADRLRGVCHSFSDGPEAARRVNELGLWVGISGMVTFKAADSIREMVAVLDRSRVLVETDSPYLAPVPHRGKRNEPSFVPLVGKGMAREWGLPVEEVASLSTAAFRELFAVDESWPRQPSTPSD
jgi:TatD DNase family protein